MAAVEPAVLSLETRIERQGERELPDDPYGSERTSIGSRREMVSKRAMDIAISVIALVVLLPVLLLLALAIKLTSPGPILFRQTRLGRYGKQFTLLKFRTMVDGADEMLAEVTHLNAATGPLFKAPSDPRLTWIGRTIRRCFFDELPQLVNVVKGDMSLVGPRPCLPGEAWQMHQFRFDAPQGVTGPWQVNGHHALTWEELADVELHYIRDWSLRSDVAILFRTISLVVRLRGI